MGISIDAPQLGMLLMTMEIDNKLGSVKVFQDGVLIGSCSGPLDEKPTCT